jgi:hypothetical protein
MFKEGDQYKKAGVMLSEISPVTRRQGDQLEPETSIDSDIGAIYLVCHCLLNGMTK